MYVCVFVHCHCTVCVCVCVVLSVCLSLCLCVLYLQYIRIKERPSLSVFLPDFVHGYLAVMLLTSPVAIVIAGVWTFLQTFLHINLFRGYCRQHLYCFHFDFRYVTLDRYIDIYIYILYVFLHVTATMNLYHNLYCANERWPISIADNLKLG